MHCVLFGGPCHLQHVKLEPGDGLEIDMNATSSLIDPATGQAVVKEEAKYSPRSYDGGDHTITIWGHSELSDEEVLQVFHYSHKDDIDLPGDEA